MTKVDFASQDKANDYISAKDYSSNALCFTLAWETYQKDAADFSL